MRIRWESTKTRSYLRPERVLFVSCGLAGVLMDRFLSYRSSILCRPSCSWIGRPAGCQFTCEETEGCSVLLRIRMPKKKIPFALDRSTKITIDEFYWSHYLWIAALIPMTIHLPSVVLLVLVVVTSHSSRTYVSHQSHFLIGWIGWLSSGWIGIVMWNHYFMRTYFT